MEPVPRRRHSDRPSRSASPSARDEHPARRPRHGAQLDRRHQRLLRRRHRRGADLERRPHADPDPGHQERRAHERDRARRPLGHERGHRHLDRELGRELPRHADERPHVGPRLRPRGATSRRRPRRTRRRRTARPGVATSPTLSVDVAADPDGDPQTVTFYGRPTPSVSDDAVHVRRPARHAVLLGQPTRRSSPPRRSGSSPTRPASTSSSSATSATSSTAATRRRPSGPNADTSMHVLDTAGVPGYVVAGNHDTRVRHGRVQLHFGTSRFAGKPWYGGYLATRPTASTTSGEPRQPGQLPPVQNRRAQVPRPPPRATTPGRGQSPWAQSVIDAHPIARSSSSPTSYADVGTARPLGRARTSGRDLIQPNCEIILVVNGHVTDRGPADRPTTPAASRSTRS